MALRFLLLLSLPLTAFTVRPGLAQEPIARIKSAPQDYRDRRMQVEGEVVEVRALSPRSDRGVYRLVDESDPVGLLVRTTRLPETGGPFRIRARLSPELLQDGVLLVDEVDRSLARTSMLPIALGFGGLGLVGAVVLFGTYFRIRRRERHLRLGPPMWLIPAAVEEPAPAEGTGEEGDGKTPPAVEFNYRLHYIEQERSSSLEQQKRRALMAAVGASVVAAAGFGWFGVLRQVDAATPSFVLLTPDPVLAEGSARDTALADSTAPPAARPDDTLRVAVATPPAAARPIPAVRPPAADTGRRRPPAEPAAPARSTTPVRQDTVAVRRDTTPFRQDTATVGSPVVVVTGAARAAAAATPPPQTVTQPPPPPPSQTTVPIDTPRVAPRPDPAALRRAAVATLDGGIRRFVASLAGQPATVAVMFQSTGDTRRRDRFLDFLRQYAPSATLRGTNEAAVAETSAEATFTVGFRWRAQFGVERRKDARFAATARLAGDEWIFENIRLLEAFP